MDKDGSSFQFDSTTIQQRGIWHLEVKNLEGDFILKDNILYSLPGEMEVNNPLSQIEREKRLLSELIKYHGYDFPINSYAVFVNPEFALYQLQRDIPIVLPTQIRRFINNINNIRSKITSTQHKLANNLFSLPN